MTVAIDHAAASMPGRTAAHALIDKIEATVAMPDHWGGLSGMLHAVTRSLLDATVTMRHEPIQPFEVTLTYAGRQLAFAAGDEPFHADPRYLLGRIDALLDVCAVAVDRSVSEALVSRVRRRKNARGILERLLSDDRDRPGGWVAADLAQAVDLEPNHLSNELRWMEAADLVRRTALGRNVQVSIGPKGESVYALANARQPMPTPIRPVKPAPEAVAAAASPAAQPVDAPAPAPAAEAAASAVVDLVASGRLRVNAVTTAEAAQQVRTIADIGATAIDRLTSAARPAPLDELRERRAELLALAGAAAAKAAARPGRFTPGAVMYATQPAGPELRIVGRDEVRRFVRSAPARYDEESARFTAAWASLHAALARLAGVDGYAAELQRALDAIRVFRAAVPLTAGAMSDEAAATVAILDALERHDGVAAKARLAAWRQDALRRLDEAAHPNGPAFPADKRQATVPAWENVWNATMAASLDRALDATTDRIAALVVHSFAPGVGAAAAAPPAGEDYRPQIAMTFADPESGVTVRINEMNSEPGERSGWLNATVQVSDAGQVGSGVWVGLVGPERPVSGSARLTAAEPGATAEIPLGAREDLEDATSVVVVLTKGSSRS